MTSKRLFYLLVALAVLLTAGLFGGAYAANGILQEKAKAISQARSKSAALEQQQAQLAKAKKDVEKYSELGDIAASIVPQDKDQAQTIREITNIANDHGIRLGSVTFPSSTLGGAAGAKTTTNAALSQLLPVPSIKGVYTLNIVLQSDDNYPVPYSKFISFLDALEHNRRTALVSGITLNPSTKNPDSVGFTLTLDEYIKQ